MGTSGGQVRNGRLIDKALNSKDVLFFIFKCHCCLFIQSLIFDLFLCINMNDFRV